MRFRVGDQVQYLKQPGRLGMIRELGPVHAGQQYYRVFWGGAEGTRTVGEDDLRPYAEIRGPSQSLRDGMLGSYADFQRLMTLQRLIRDEPLRNNVYAFNASRTQFFPYQFKPLLKFLESSRNRLLICDEVGLGKTIEAGLILLELRARQTMRLVLVICPSNLRNKWKLELRQRFGEDFRVLDSSQMMAFLADYEEAPDRVQLNGIISIESLRTERVHTRLEELGVPFDLIIADEAHHFRNFGTSQRRAAATVAETAQSMIFLTATPIQLGQENLYSLLNLLDVDDFSDEESALDRFRDNEVVVRAQNEVARREPDYQLVATLLEEAGHSIWVARHPRLPAVTARVLNAAAGHIHSRREHVELQRDLAELNLLGHILTRTRRRDVQEHVSVRRAYAFIVRFSAREQALYDEISELIREEADQAGESSWVARWRLNTPQRRMASSIRGMIEDRRDGEDVDDDASDEEASNGTTRSVAAERISRLMRDWPSDEPDEKYETLKGILRGTTGSIRTEKALVFATFRGTLRYLSRRLNADGIRTVLLSGDVPVDERPRVIERFASDPSVKVLLSSRVGSEGLDFQFCNTVVNYDLPWNPMEVEQRIGRVDRIGQKSDVITIVNLWTEGTIEERILRRLYERVGVFRNAIGDLEPIIGEVTALIQNQTWTKARTAEEEAQEVERIASLIENRRAHVETLDQASARFVGADAFFESEVKAIRERRRYVTGEQLYQFLHDFIRRQTPRTRLEYAFDAKAGVLFPDEALRTFLRREGRAGETLNLMAAGSEGVRVTFDAQVAFEERHIEFLNVLHPLVVAITDFYQREETPTAAQHLALHTDCLPPGFYFFVVYKLHLHALRSFSALECVVLDEAGAEACDPDVAEALLGEMVERGEQPSEPIEVDPQHADVVLRAAELAFLQRASEIERLEQESNDAVVDQRATSLTSYFQKNIAKKSGMLERGAAAGRQERYLRMLRGQLVKMEGELAAKKQELENLREVTTESIELAAGILEVLHT